MKILAALAKEKNQPLVIEDIDIDEPKENEVLIKIVASGICHTDAESIKGNGTPFPAVLGHEGAGIVEKVGSSVDTVAVGDHVILSYSYCNSCSQCLTGHHNLCVRTVELNFGGKLQDHTYRLHKERQDYSTFFGQSSFATYAVTNKHNVVKVDKDVDLRLLGPLGCGIQTGSGTVMNSLHPEPGTSIAIYGSGAVGLSAVMAANLLGLKNIIVVDIHDNRLELAKELGATHALNSKNLNVVDEIKKITDGGVHYAIETTGVPIVIKNAIAALRVAGKISIVGMGGDVTLNFTNDILMEGKTIVGTIQGDSTPQMHIPKIIQYYKEGKFPFDKLIKFYDFKDINQAFEDSKIGVTIKPVVLIDQ
ncbi:NAD(P)-dependent alcohol dehydrogenase [Acinetobacter sp. ANC 4635]|uniref:NAD(P)-dependent alcohol dehydrogenase n=1 Tax=Acinetobacter sp. ANC 4635 TaxID=2529846 RepID=UPI00103CFC5B|nr:NAD(P)-dependent alcohol dehydrogenase [Acinetobacter sp. ANC 4635]TCB26279.1 NAD(P)-dependent alcohol dehydrogenase [Acinetobacter sp. ANC 4635]